MLIVSFYIYLCKCRWWRPCI